MRLAGTAPIPADDLPVTLPSAWTDRSLATLDYVLRAPDGAVKETQIVAVPFPDEARQVPGGFLDAVRVAQELAAVPIMDTLHRLPVNQAHGVLQAADGAWWVAPLGGDHRGFRGPLFVDGDFYRRSGLSVFASKQSVSEPLRAIVGVEQVMDLRRPLRAGVQPLAEWIAREEANLPTRREGDGWVPAQPVPGGTPDQRAVDGRRPHAVEAEV